MKVKYKHIRRKFSEEFRQEMVKEIDQGKMSVTAVAREYSVSGSAVYQWLAKHSVHYRRATRVIVEKQSTENKLKELRARIAELERTVGQKQLRIDYLEKVVEVAGTELGVDIKKKSARPSSNGSGHTGTNTPGR
jgi:transposase-like protein